MVLQTAFLGDVLLSVPLLKRLKKLNYSVSYVCREGLATFLEQTGLVQEVFEVRKGDSSSYRKALKAMGVFDLALCPHQSLRSGLMFQRIRAKQKISFRTFWSFFVSDQVVVRDLSLPDALRQLSLLSPIDTATLSSMKVAKDVDFAQARLSEGIPSEIEAHSSMRIQGLPAQKLPEELRPPYVCLAPGSRWLTKRWSVDGFRAVAVHYQTQGFQVVCVGSPDERAIAEEVCMGIPGALNLAGKSRLLDLASVLASASLLVCNDSGAMHMASVVGTPTVSLFGPTTLDLGYQPWNPKAVVIQNQELKCRPCGKHGHMKCPLGTHECMKSLSAQQVIDASLRLIPDLKSLSR